MRRTARASPLSLRRKVRVWSLPRAEEQASHPLRLYRAFKTQLLPGHGQRAMQSQRAMARRHSKRRALQEHRLWLSSWTRMEIAACRATMLTRMPTSTQTRPHTAIVIASVMAQWWRAILTTVPVNGSIWHVSASRLPQVRKVSINNAPFLRIAIPSYWKDGANNP